MDNCKTLQYFYTMFLMYTQEFAIEMEETLRVYCTKL
jgi:hypothetical protein